MSFFLLFFSIILRFPKFSKIKFHIAKREDHWKIRKKQGYFEYFDELNHGFKILKRNVGLEYNSKNQIEY